MNYSTKCCAVVDNGLFVEVATALAPAFGEVLYYSPWESAFPKSNSTLIGVGIPGVTRVNTIYDRTADVDLWVFPDVYYGAFQCHLEELGKRVWGSRLGERLELDRVWSKECLAKLGVPIGRFEVIIGLDALRVYLKSHRDQWVKISCTRGDMETFHSKNYKLIEPRLDELEHNLGAKKKIMEFIVEDDIDEVTEVGYDGYAVDGSYPSCAMVGIEAKNKGYLGMMQDTKHMLPQVQAVNNAIVAQLREWKYRNFISLEMRITDDGTPYVIDPCTRLTSPPGELLLAMYTNLADIFWEGAEGRCIDPIPAGKYGAELVISSGWADKNWQAIEFPAKLRPFIKLRNLAIIDGRYYCVPQAVGLNEVGSIVAYGETLDEAIEACEEYSHEVEGYFLEVHPECLEDIKHEFDTVEDSAEQLEVEDLDDASD